MQEQPGTGNNLPTEITSIENPGHLKNAVQINLSTLHRDLDWTLPVHCPLLFTLLVLSHMEFWAASTKKSPWSRVSTFFGNKNIFGNKDIADTGIDGIPAMFLKGVADVLRYQLTHIIN